MSLVRDGMLSDPTTIDAGATAQEAAEHLVRPDVRALLVVGDGGTLLGVVTPDSLVEHVLAGGLGADAPVTAAVVPPVLVLDGDQPLEEGYRLLEEAELERAPVTEQGRLVGVLSRSVVQRRLAEDERAPDDTGDHS